MDLIGKTALSRFLLPDRGTAIAALQSVGGVLQPQMTLTVDHETLGMVFRYFAILGDIRPEGAAIPELRDVLLPLLLEAENAQIVERLDAGKMDYMPVNKTLVQRLLPALHTVRVHVPWTYRAMNFDLGVRVTHLDSKSPVPYSTYYSQVAQFYGKNPKRSLVELGRLYSMRVDGSTQGSWLQPIDDGFVDEDVALIIEANVVDRGASGT